MFNNLKLNVMSYEEISKMVEEIALQSWNLCKEARRFQNCRVMSLTAVILSAVSDMLFEAHEDLTED